MRIGFVRHLDFTAKELDDPHARPKTFFTEVITTEVHHINVCQYLGRTASLPSILF